MIRRAADLFCGAGGTSTGYVRACQAGGFTPELYAYNHNPTAVKTHELNHPGVRHLCEEIERIKPTDEIPGGHLHLLCASPECTHFSLAAGGRPRNDQSRAQAWQVLNWATKLDILFRMLQPHELAAAQGFPKDYQFSGTREQRVKQIGNAVPVNLATALCAALLR